MSCDAAANLVGSLGNFGASLHEAMERDRVPPRGSPAEKEADGEPFAGDWDSTRHATSTLPSSSRPHRVPTT
jgi:hypothetical protein